jgi:hypothetical protein
MHAKRIGLCAALLSVGLFARVTADSLDAAPHRSLSPEQVVRCQMEALRSNDNGDNGIAAAFRFASPGNKQATGPLPRFIHMIKHSPYSVMLDPQLIEYGDVQIADNRAQLQVSVLSVDYVAIAFRFYLSRQTHAGCDGCWMTDGVTVEGARQLPGVKT